MDSERLTEIEKRVAENLERLAYEIRNGKGRITSVTYEPQISSFHTLGGIMQTSKIKSRPKLSFDGFDEKGEPFEFEFFASGKELGIVG